MSDNQEDEDATPKKRTHGVAIVMLVLAAIPLVFLLRFFRPDSIHFFQVILAYFVMLVILFFTLIGTKWGNEWFDYISRAQDESPKFVQSLLLGILGLAGLLVVVLAILGFTRGTPAGPDTTFAGLAYTWFTSSSGVLSGSVLVVLFGMLMWYGFQQNIMASPSRLLVLGLLALAAIFGSLWMFQQPTMIPQFTQFQRPLMWLFGILFVGLVVGWLITTLLALQQESDRTSSIHFWLNVVLVATVVMFVYRVFNVELPGETARGSFLDMLYYGALYLPCLLNAGLTGLVSTVVGEERSRNVSLLVLAVVGVAAAGLRYYPTVLNPLLKQGGESILNQPARLDSRHVVRTVPSSTRALSFWFYLDAQGANNSPAYGRPASILSVAGGQPEVLYEGQRNRLFVQWHGETLFEASHVPLQRWNNVVLNYDSGTLDIFLNNRLVKSIAGKLPNYGNEALTVGENDGIQGDVCNVLLFDHPLSSTRQFFLYNLFAARSPPVMLASDVLGPLEEKVPSVLDEPSNKVADVVTR